MSEDITVSTHGPMFDGSALRAADRYCERALREVAQYGENLIHERLHQVLRHPTGRYEGAIRTDRRSDTMEISDGWPGSGIVYGPWLEGVGSRNRSTRFKGYFTFRIVGDKLDAEAQAKAEEYLPPYLAEMNG